MTTKNEYDLWEPVIGLEIHVQLNTKTKLFSHAPNRFGDEPNTNITDVCTGQPGTLPVLNKEAVRKAVQFGCAIQGTVALFSKFDRKSYFYPDSPRNYQITQFDQPIILGGFVEAEVEGAVKRFAINRAHIEDDAGMLKHFSSFAGVDYNRAGVPLIEVVSEPCIHSAKEAAAYATAIRSIMDYLNASDCNMEEGSLRMDANISVRRKGETALRSKIEIKNMNSFNNMEMAIDIEIARQIDLYTRYPEKDQTTLISPGTYRFDPETKQLVMMRSKENAEDYRYFPEPDLPPVILTQAYIDQVRSTLPELPLERLRRYTQELGLAQDTAYTLIADKQLCEYFEEALISCKNPKALSNWLVVEFTGRIKESGLSLRGSNIPPQHVTELVNMIEEGIVTGKIAKSVADDMVASPALSAKTIVENNPQYQPISDVSSIESLVDQVLQENPQSIIDFKAGKTRAYGFLVGQVMKLCQGKASPALVNELLNKKL